MLLVSASQIVTWRGRGAVGYSGTGVRWPCGSQRTNLVILTACLKQALLDGKLQKVIVIVMGRCLPLATQHAVASGGLEQGGRDLASTAGG